MAHAWKACWVQALKGSNPLFSAVAKPRIPSSPPLGGIPFLYGASSRSDAHLIHGRFESTDEQQMSDTRVSSMFLRRCGGFRRTFDVGATDGRVSMNASMNEWNVGYVLSEDEVSVLEDSGGLTELVAVTTHPTPGGYFSDPYAGTYLLQHTSGHCFASLPDVSDPDSEPNEIVHLGKPETDDELLAIVTAFLLADDHEVAAAVKFHFDETDFGPDDWFWQALPEFYWFRLSENLSHQASRLDLELKSLSPLYAHMAAFLDKPNSPEFELLRQEVNGQNFEALYSRYKYNQAED